MKKLVFLMLCTCTALQSGVFAQSFGVKAGLSLSDVHLEEGGNEFYKMNPGFHAGVVMEFPFSNNWSFESGALLTTKGFKFDLQIFDTKLELTSTPYYLNIPITIKRYFDVGGTRIFGTFGPYTSIGLFGKVEERETTEGVTETEKTDIKWGATTDDNLRRFEYGLTLGVGVRIKSFEVGASYLFGLTDISPVNEDEGSLNHRVILVSVGYRLPVKSEAVPEE